MTPEEIARDILRWAANQDRDFGGALEIEWVDRIAAALRQYAAAERERCAEIALALGWRADASGAMRIAATTIAAAIRALEEPSIVP